MSERARGFESHPLRLGSSELNGLPFVFLEGAPCTTEKIEAYDDKRGMSEKSIACIIRGHFGEVPKLAEGAPLERE